MEYKTESGEPVEWRWESWGTLGLVETVIKGVAIAIGILFPLALLGSGAGLIPRVGMTTTEGILLLIGPSASLYLPLRPGRGCLSIRGCLLDF